LVARRHRCSDADVARDPDPETCAFDLDLGQAGFVEQQRKLANERAVVAGKLCSGFFVWLERHDVDPKLSCLVAGGGVRLWP
jgi:hypothetical protein